VGNLSSTLTSGVVRSLFTEVAVVALIGTVACAWNAAVVGLYKLNSVDP
jgi:putative membrane protein